MELNEYQKQAMTTCTQSSRNESYMLLNLSAEVGELLAKVAKGIRKEKCVIDGNRLFYRGSPLSETIEYEDGLMAEAGDVLWQLSGFCSVMGWKLEDVAQMNLSKLQSRKERGVIVGDGDKR